MHPSNNICYHSLTNFYFPGTVSPVYLTFTDSCKTSPGIPKETEAAQKERQLVRNLTLRFQAPPLGSLLQSWLQEALELRSRPGAVLSITSFSGGLRLKTGRSQEETPTSPLGTDPELLSNGGPSASGWPRCVPRQPCV